MKKYFFILLLLTLSSCDVFNTRSSEPPTTQRGNYQPATTTDMLLQNLQNSFKDKLLDNYMACFSDKIFSFSPSAGSVSRYSILQNWTRQEEGQFFNNLINSVPQNSIIELVFSNDRLAPQSDSTSYSAKYTITVPFLDEKKPKVYQGNLHFTMIRDSKLQWVISYWMDIKDEQYPSWSELKGSLN